MATRFITNTLGIDQKLALCEVKAAAQHKIFAIVKVDIEYALLLIK